MARMAAVLDAEYDSAEDAAHAVLAEAERMYQEKAKYAVLGQLRYKPGHGWPKPDDKYADKITLLAFATEKQASNAAKALAYSSQTHEEFRCWVVPIHHGSPAEYYRERKEKEKSELIEHRSYFEQELARRVQWLADNPDQELPEDMRGVIPLIDPAKQE